MEPTFLLWQIRLKHNQIIFHGEKRFMQQVWLRVLQMVQENMEAKCDMFFPLEKRDVGVVERLGIQELSMASMCVRRGQ